MPESLYNILGVNKNADKNELKKSYRKLALKHHPDRGGNKDIFQKITDAYEILNDDNKRKIYDMHGIEAVRQGMGGPNDANDVFSSFFGNSNFMNMNMNNNQNNQKKEALVDEIIITMEQVYTGCTINKQYNINCKCNKCNGTGSKTGKCTTCNKCKGSGVQTTVRRMGPMIQQMQTMCSSCKGKGEIINDKDRCKYCNGKKAVLTKKNIEIKINPGVQEDEKIIFENKGHYKSDKSISDLVIIVKIKEHEKYKRINKSDIMVYHNISLIDLLTYSTQKIKHLNNKDIYFSSSSLIDPEKSYKLVNYGLQFNNGNTGDLYIKFKIDFPNNLNTNNNYKNTLKEILNQDYSNYNIKEENIKLLIEDFDEDIQDDDNDEDVMDGNGVQCQQQ